MKKTFLALLLLMGLHLAGFSQTPEAPKTAKKETAPAKSAQASTHKAVTPAAATTPQKSGQAAAKAKPAPATQATAATTHPSQKEGSKPKETSKKTADKSKKSK